MVPRPSFLVLCVFAVGLIASSLTHAVQDQSAEEAAVKNVVISYRDRMKSGDSEEVEKLLGLFLNPEVPVLVFGSKDPAHEVKSVKALTYVGATKFFAKQRGPISTKVDSLKVEILTPSFAVATVVYSNKFVNGREVFTLRLAEGNWKIAALVTETTKATTETKAQEQKNADEVAGSAVIRVLVRDPNARVFLDGYKTSSTGTERQFRTPALKESVKYQYQIRVTWVEGGREVSEERIARVRPGQTLVVDFTMPVRETVPPPASGK